MSSTYLESIEFTVPVTECAARLTGSGITAEALEFLRENKQRIGKLHSVEIVMPFGMSCPNTITRFIDTEGRYLEVDGLTYGYAGEGPRGMATALRLFGLSVTARDVLLWDGSHITLQGIPRR